MTHTIVFNLTDEEIAEYSEAVNKVLVWASKQGQKSLEAVEPIVTMKNMMQMALHDKGEE